MKLIFRIFTCAAALILLGACNIKPEAPLKEFHIDSVAQCSHISQQTSIKFSFDEADRDKNIAFSAVDNVDWITELETSKSGEIIAHIEENSGQTRTATITLSAAGYKSAKIQFKQFGVPTEVASHTLMFYFFGRSLDRYFKGNIEDAIKAIESGILGVNNRVILFRHEDKATGYIAELIYDIESGKCTESVMESGITIEGNPIEPSFITKIIDKMTSIAPAERYGLVMAGHGQAWLTREMLNGSSGISTYSYTAPLFTPAAGAEVTRAFGESNVQVNPGEIAEGINNSIADIDYILFDACFMSNIETIYELRNSANYIIASPCEIMGKGFPYEYTLPHLFINDGANTDYAAAAESYYLYYRDRYSSPSRCGSIAVYECSEIEALKEATKEVVKSAKSLENTSYLQTYEGQNPHYFYDFGEWVNAVGTDRAALNNFNVQLEKTVIAKYTLDSFYSAYGSYGTYPIDINVYSGVTTSAPSSKLNSYWKQTEWYKSVWEL